MDKFGGLFNITATDLKSVLRAVGIGKDTTGSSVSMRQANRELERAKREYDRVTSKLMQIKKGDIKNERMLDEINNFYERATDNFQAKKRELEQLQIQKELEKTGTLTKISESIKDLKASGILGRVGDFLMGKGLITMGGGIIGVFGTQFQLLNEIIDDTGFFSKTVLNNFTQLREEMEVLNRLGEDFSVTTATHLKIATELSKTHGAINNASVRTLDSIANLEYTMGITNEEAVQFLDTFRGITGESVQTNLELLKSVAILGNRESIPFRILMEDISSNADFFASNMGRGNEEMLKGVIYARRMGIELSTMTGVLDSFSNLENVIESSMQLSLITGRQINFLQSASDAFFGNTEGAMESLLEQIGRVDDATFDLPFVRKQFAEQLGVSTQEVVKMRQAVQTLGVEASLIDFGFEDEIASFSDLISGLGFRRLKIEAQKNILQPINSAFDKYINVADKIINAGVSVIKTVGNFTEWYFDKLGIAGAVLPAFVGGLAKLASMGATQTTIQVAQLAELKKLNASSLLSPIGGAGKGTLRALKGAGGLLVGGGMASATYGANTDNDMATLIGVLGGIGGGALMGAGLGVPGLIGGAILGGLTAGLPALFGSGLAEGGIVTKEMIQPIAEKNQREAVIPLDSARGKSSMTLDLSDSSINKLVNKMAERGMAKDINFYFNGNKVDDSEEFLKLVASSK